MSKKYIIVGIILIAGLAGGMAYFKQQQPKIEAPAQAVQSDFKVKGPATAPVTIVEYSDFQCPACGAAEPLIKQIMKNFPGQVRFEFRHFPLAGHQWSSRAHQAAQCAGLQGQFWSYHDLLFQTQRSWSVPTEPTETFLKYASDLRLDLDWFAVCLTDQSVQGPILKDKQEGIDLKVTSTPTFFINGERVVGHINLLKEGVPMIQKILGLPVTEFDVVEKN